MPGRNTRSWRRKQQQQRRRQPQKNLLQIKWVARVQAWIGRRRTAPQHLRKLWQGLSQVRLRLLRRLPKQRQHQCKFRRLSQSLLHHPNLRLKIKKRISFLLLCLITRQYYKRMKLTAAFPNYVTVTKSLNQTQAHQKSMIQTRKM